MYQKGDHNIYTDKTDYTNNVEINKRYEDEWVKSDVRIISFCISKAVVLLKSNRPILHAEASIIKAIY